jgi:hypothetical protein
LPSTGTRIILIDMDSLRRIVLTGGPGGGKSTLLRELRAEDPNSRRWVLVPEAATILLSAGLAPGTQVFQQAVVRLQVTLEDACLEGDVAGRAFICDRGTVDSLAYWRLSGWDEREFFAATGMGPQAHLGRYFGAIHLQTAAIGAEEHYRRWPEAVRRERLEQAARIDSLCAQVWSGHPRYVLIENAGRDWQAKSRAAHEVLRQWLQTSEGESGASTLSRPG